MAGIANVCALGASRLGIGPLCCRRVAVWGSPPDRSVAFRQLRRPACPHLISRLPRQRTLGPRRRCRTVEPWKLSAVHPVPPAREVVVVKRIWSTLAVVVLVAVPVGCGDDDDSGNDAGSSIEIVLVEDFGSGFHPVNLSALSPNDKLRPKKRRRRLRRTAARVATATQIGSFPSVGSH